MYAIRQIVEIARQVYKAAEKMKQKQPVTEFELRVVLDGYEEVKGDVQISTDFPWEKVRRAENAEHLHKMVEVLARAIRRRIDESREPGESAI